VDLDVVIDHGRDRIRIPLPQTSNIGFSSIDRDLSWLEFNRRVLQEALDERTPLLERAKFLAIFSSNLDEFVITRLAQLRPAAGDRIPAARQRRELLLSVRERIVSMLEAETACYENVLRPRLAENGIHLVDWGDLTEDEREQARAFFDDRIAPLLTPISLDAARLFPHTSNPSTSWAFRIVDPVTGESVIVLVHVPRDLPRWLPMTAGDTRSNRVFVGTDAVIAANADKLFPGMTIGGATLIRACRDEQLAVADDDIGKRALVELQLTQRRFAPVVRLEVQPNPDPAIVARLRDHFGLAAEDIYDMHSILDYTTLFEIAALEIEPLRDRPWTPLVPTALEASDDDFFAAIRAGDILLHHPYDSFDAGVDRFIREAADDASTVSIKMTIYRVGDDTPLMRSLIRAAEAGKEVACVIELNARFDEARNLHWSRELEKAGAHVVHGVTALKTHSKTALVVRQERDGFRSYAHIATGNYHTRTARIYEDLGLLTADPALTRDVLTLFNFLTGHARTPLFSSLLVAPMHLRSAFVRLVEKEIENAVAGGPARIVCKMNQLEDPQMCALLARASRAGVPVDLIVRGLCCLAPGVPGVTSNVHVRSIIGRFLEHSRIFHFAAGSNDPLDGEFLIGSADWMHRNLSDRVEAAVPIRDRHLRARLWEILDTCLADRRNAWRMRPDGSYVQLFPSGADDIGSAGTHVAMMRSALARRDL
jgi:polyphosphate kinase